MDKIICLGKNYLEHAKELGDAIPEKPVLFLKPPGVILQAEENGDELTAEFPEGRGELHHECELVVRIFKDLRNATQAEAARAFDAVTIGLDLTLRTEQNELKKKGHPWEVSKVFADSAILGPWLKLSQFPDYVTTPFQFTVDGKLRQKGDATQMRMGIAEAISYASRYFPIRSGDILFTGTPAGVGPLLKGSVGTVEWGSKLRYLVQWA